MTAVEIADLVLAILKVAGPAVVGLVARFIDGDRSEETRRAVDMLPKELRSSVALAAERAETERQLREAMRTERERGEVFAAGIQAAGAVAVGAGGAVLDGAPRPPEGEE